MREWRQGICTVIREELRSSHHQGRFGQAFSDVFMVLLPLSISFAYSYSHLAQEIGIAIINVNMILVFPAPCQSSEKWVIKAAVVWAHLSLISTSCPHAPAPLFAPPIPAHLLHRQHYNLHHLQRNHGRQKRRKHQEGGGECQSTNVHLNSHYWLCWSWVFHVESRSRRTETSRDRVKIGSGWR